MADGYNAVRLHLVWATFDRLPLLTPVVRAVVYEEIRTAARKVGCRVEAIGGTEDHIHVLLRFVTTVSIADAVQAMKGTSSRMVERRVPDAAFKWQGTYGVFPVTPSAVARVTTYIAEQAEHHAQRTVVPSLERTSAPHPPSAREQPAEAGFEDG